MFQLLMSLLIHPALAVYKYGKHSAANEILLDFYNLFTHYFNLT